MRFAVAVLLLAGLVAGCDDDQKYSRTDVERAFHSKGLDLTADMSFPPAPKGSFSGTAYSLERGPGPLVLVYDHDGDAADAFQTLHSQATSETFDARKGNVVVTSDEGLSRPLKKQIRSALSELQ